MGKEMGVGHRDGERGEVAQRAEEGPSKTEEIVEPAPAPAPEQDLPDDNDATAGCPGGDLVTCIDVCPGFNKVAFGLCVTECGKRCP
jgi:hypothetical protein